MTKDTPRPGKNLVALTLSTGLYSTSTLGVPLVAMLVLPPAQYGAFSLVYLISGLAVTLQLALVSEAWVRRRNRSAHAATWNEYSNATILISLISASLGCLLSLLVPPMRTSAALVFIAVFLGNYRAGARFYSLHQLSWRRIVPGDALGSAVVLVAAALLIGSGSDTFHVSLAWAACRVAGVIYSQVPNSLSIKASRDWFFSHKREIRALLPDSVMFSVANMATPYMLTPILGLANLGIYRAVGNVGGPLRALIATLRPVIARLTPTRLASNFFAAALLGTSLAIAVLASGALFFLTNSDLDLGTLSSLRPYILVVGVYFLALMIDTVYAMIARQLVSARRLLKVRLTISIISIVGPVAAGLLGGLTGAIWAYSLVLLLSGGAFWRIVWRQSVAGQG